MQQDKYATALNKVTIADLSAMLKGFPDAAPANWSSLKAPEKRIEFMNLLLVSADLRQAFVTKFNELTGSSETFMDWEAEAAPAVEPAGDVVPASDTAPGKGKVGQFVDDAFQAMIADVAGLDAEASKAAVRHAEEDLEFEHMRLGILLGHIHTSQHFMTLGYDNMRQYLAAETGLEYRKAMHLVQNARVVQELGIPGKELKGVTWSALRHILPVLTAENYKKWLQAARSMKHVTLIAAVNEEKTKAKQLPAPGGDKPADAAPVEVTQKVFTIYPEQKATIDAAISKAKLEANTDSQGAALDVICSSYIGSPVSGQSIKSVLPDMSDDGLLNILTKIDADEGKEGLLRLLTAVEKVWPDVEIMVNFAPADEAATA